LIGLTESAWTELTVGVYTRAAGILAGLLGILVGLIGLNLNSIGLHSVTWDDITFDFFDGNTFQTFIIVFTIWCLTIAAYFVSYMKTRGGYTGILAGVLSLLAIIPWVYQYIIVRSNTGSLNSEHYFSMASLLELAMLILGTAFILGGIVPLLRIQSHKLMGLTGLSLISVGLFGMVIGLWGLVPGFTFFDWYWIPFFTILSLIPSVLLLMGYRE
jgi:hypothetical protein